MRTRAEFANGVRGRLTPDEMRCLTHHPGWDDGREGYLWCRFDAMLSPEDDPRHLRAELTWDDDSEFDDNETGDPTCYFDPELWVETNRRVVRDHRLETYDGFKVILSRQEAAEILLADPKELLAKYADEIAKLRCWAPKGDG